MRVVFMGTPDFAVPCLARLVEDGHDVVGVFTQPDKPKGRGKQLAPPPVKEKAMEHDIPVYQPRSMRDGEAMAILEELQPELIIVTAFGKILPKEVLDFPKYGCINMHASLLPAYRGAAPIQWCVLNGEKVTGVTAMQMDVGLDTGDMLLRCETPIGENETAGELHDRLSVMGAELMHDTIEALLKGELQPEKQDDAKSNYAPMLTKELSHIDFTKSAQQVHDWIRGLSPWPAAEMTIGEKKLKVHASVLCADKGNRPGEVMESGKRLVISCGDGKCVEIQVLQAQGKKAMPAADFMRGNPIEKGTIVNA